MMQMSEITEGATADHRFYGEVTITQTRNAYQGMVMVRKADGSEVAALIGDMEAK